METTQSTHPTSRELAALALGKLAPQARERWHAHVSGCPTCREFLARNSRAELISLLQTGAAPRSAAEQSTPAAQQSRATYPPTARPPLVKASALDAVSLNAVPRPGVPSPQDVAADDSIPLALRQQTKYRIVRLLGRGGMGSVYEVHHERMDRRQALKVINPELVDDPQVLLRFGEEIKAVAKLDHPNIARADDAESFGTLQVVVMEFVPGLTLYDMLQKRGRLPVPEACRYIRQACMGLQHAHEKGLVHRDLKPQNLMLAEDKGIVKILDFGLAKIVSENNGGRGLTRTNMTMGTYEYCAPEQALDAASADIRADIYSLGCTIYYMIAGVLPFAYSSATKLLLAHQHETPRPLVEVCPEVPQGLSDLIDCMLEKNPADRPQTPAEIAKILLPFASGEIAPPVPFSLAGDDCGLAGMIADFQMVTPHPGPKARKETGAKPLPTRKRDGRFWQRCRSALPRGLPIPGWRLVLKIAAVAWIGAMCLYMATRNFNGTLVVENADPAAEVLVFDAQGKLVHHHAAGAKRMEITIAPGKGRLQLLKNGVELFSQEFYLPTGGRQNIDAKSSFVDDETPYVPRPPGYGAGINGLGAMPAQRVAAAEVDNVPSRPNSAGVTIISARWGVGNRWMDVTQRVRQLATAGADIWASCDAMNGDPRPNNYKYLEIRYVKDGQSRFIQVGEGFKLDSPDFGQSIAPGPPRFQAAATPVDASPQDMLTAGSVWKGTRSYRQGGYQGLTVAYELHIQERDGAKFTGFVFDNGPNRNRAEVEGEVNGNAVTWRERARGNELTMDAQLNGSTLNVRFSGRYSNGVTNTGDGTLQLENR